MKRIIRSTVKDVSVTGTKQRDSRIERSGVSFAFEEEERFRELKWIGIPFQGDDFFRTDDRSFDGIILDGNSGKRLNR